MKLISLPLCALLLSLFPTTLRACLNDRDTLEAEARGVPDVMRALSGRFERNPPLFYEMRMQRVERELQSAPQRLDLYDDIAVAADRIGRSDEALKWIEKKRARLQVLDAKKPNVREHWYRYWANVGTFRAHRWIHNGAHRSKIGEMKQAHAEIARAIAIKPDAHFGREKYQLKVMQWILKPPSTKDVPNKLPDVLGLSGEHAPYGQQSGREELKKRGYADAERGLAGLITLGAAWQSIDVFNTLRYVEAWRGDSKVFYLLSLRLQEMAQARRTSLHPQAPNPHEMTKYFDPTYSAIMLGTSRLYGAEEQQTHKAYRLLRDEADAWHARRTAFMLERLKTGRHPDTDPKFWSGWDDGTPPSLRPPTRWERMAERLQAPLPALAIVLIAGGSGALVVRRRRKRCAA